VISLASIDEARGAMTWVGVGNVEALLSRAGGSEGARRERILLRSGVVGYQLPPLRSGELAIGVGDMLVFASDGLSHQFCDAPMGGRAPGELADHLLRAYAKTTDDALVLVARYRGPAA
jgi:hypothetical protein